MAHPSCRHGKPRSRTQRYIVPGLPAKQLEWTVDGDFAEQFARMALELHAEPSLGDTVEAVAGYAVKAIGCGHAAVLQTHGHKAPEITATDPVAAKACQVELDCGQGPSLTGLKQREWVLVRDAGTDPRWPAWSAAIVPLELHSVLSIRLHAGHRTLGAITLFDTALDVFDEDDVAVADILARHASIAVSHAQQESNLWRAVDARKVIGQAQGILMERFALSADQAFAVLRRYSQDYNIKLRDVAQRLVDTRKLPES